MSLVTALVAWATGDAGRIAQLKAERDALVEGMLTGNKASLTLTNTSVGGKSFSGLVSLTREQKLELFTNVLIALGEVDDPRPTGSYMNLEDIVR